MNFQPGKPSWELPGWNFSLVWATQDEIFIQVHRAKITHVIDKKFQPRLKIHKRRMHFEVKFKRRFTARVEISHVIVRKFQPGQPGWKSPCNQVSFKSIFHTKVHSHFQMPWVSLENPWFCPRSLPIKWRGKYINERQVKRLVRI